MIKAMSRIYEFGLKQPSDFFETPGTWLTFDFDNHPEMDVGIMTYTHGLCIDLTIKEYLDMFKEAGIYERMKENNYEFLKTSFMRCEQELTKAKFEVNFSGTTCVLALLLGII